MSITDGTLLRAHLGAGIGLALVCVAMPAGLAGDLLYSLISCACVMVMVAGIRRHCPPRPLGWYLITAGVASWVLGDLLWAFFFWVLHIDPFPSPADILYLLAYVFLALGCWHFVRARRGPRDREGLIDSAICTVGFGLLSWSFLMRPTLAAEGVSGLTKVLSAAYPVGDVLLLALLVRLLTAQGSRSAAFRLLCAGAGLMLAADCTYQLLGLHSDDGGALPALCWLLAYVCFGAATLHPSMRTLTDAGVSDAGTLTRGRLVALTAASLLAPGTLLLQLALGLQIHAWAVAVSSVILFLLVVLRMSGLMRRLEEHAAALAALTGTDALTGLPNRRTSDAEWERLREKSSLDGSALALAIVDLDRFKAFNDTFGHQAGDQLLIGAGSAWVRKLGEHAGADAVPMLARWGGEEFLVLLPGHVLPDAGRIVDGLRRLTPDGQSFSAGVAQWDGLEDLGRLLYRADRALYEAKAAGRDRVVLAAAERQAEAALS